jgi:putative aldouronate transport system permease protein
MERLQPMKKETLFSEIRKHKFIYLLALPGIAYFVIFSYLPMFGVVIAFKEFRMADGILGSPWNGFKNFEFFFTSGDAWRVTRNTLSLNAMFLVSITFCQVFFAILINEAKGALFRKFAQSVMFLPYFMSWIIVSVIVMGFLGSDTGTVNKMLAGMGLEPVAWFSSPQLWPAILVILNVWKWTGYGVVIYLATIVGIDNSLYESAVIDGAGRIQQIWSITLPLLKPTIIILTLLSIGKIFYGDVGLIYGIIGDNAMLFPTTDVIDTYVLRALRTSSDLGMSTAIGLWQSVMGFILVLVSNKLANKYESEGALF